MTVQVDLKGNTVTADAFLPTTKQSTKGTVTGYGTGSSTAVTIDGTFTGNSGSNGYTIGDVVLALKNSGLLTP